ncbi:polyphosphate kinase 2 family protein [Nocardia carnea]|uniref:polyphosphate kinase 2 family protein n=1 Tax=Nocardia carnea TaxID=37328 RepID=UPI002454A881|nr:polyphosphate kinase 2 family protein [Nocardia carnea]
MTEHWTDSASRVLRADGLRIADLDTSARPGFHGGKSDGKRLLAERGQVLAAQQELLYANGRAGDRRSVLLVLQGMDTAGKGGIVRHVIGSVDPQGVDHMAFGVPTEEEQRHHFLWRIRRALPRGGQLGVFDRSHYEDVLVARVHGLVPEHVWQGRYEEINQFERELTDAGTTLVKVALFVSLDEQKNRLRQRLERPEKYWKFNPADIDERGYWPAYQEAYQAMLDRTGTGYAPWYVVPADAKWYARLAVTELLIEALRTLDLSWPAPTFDPAAELRRLENS